MSHSISQRELRNDSAEIMRRLDRGESFVVTRRGMPVGELTPLHRPRFVTVAAVTEAFRHAPALDRAAFRRDVDRAVDQEIHPRA